MINKLSDKDKKDWNNFLNSKEKLEVKDKDTYKKTKIPEKSIDLSIYLLGVEEIF